MRAAAALFLAAIPSLALAQTTFVGTRVSTADYPDPIVMAPLPPLLPGAPLRILFDYLADGQPPIATIDGDTIEVAETIPLDPPTQPRALYLIDLGPQPAGRYHMSMQRVYLQKGISYPGISTMTFLVQPTPASSPCSATPLANVPIVQVTRTGGGTAHLHLEAIGRGYALQWGVPAVVDVRANAIDIEQTLSDIDPSQAVGMPLVLTCHSEDIDLGVLPPGSYSVSWGAVVKSGKVMNVVPTHIAFDWNGASTTCTTTPELSVAAGITLSMRRMTNETRRAPTTVDVRGHVITVVDAINSIPVPDTYPTPVCVASSVTAGALAPGDYTVNWQTMYEALPPQPLATFHVTIPAPRARAARH